MVINKPVISAIATSEGGGTGTTVLPYRNTANYTLNRAHEQDSSQFMLNTNHTPTHTYAYTRTCTQMHAHTQMHY